MELYFPVAGVHVAWPWLLLVGLSVGVLVGFFGVGGGWLATPSLNILGFPIVYAVGTSLAYVAGAAVIGTVRHYRLGNLGVRLGAILGLSGIAGVEVSRRLVLYLEGLGLADTYVRTAYILLLWAVGGSVVLEYVRSRTAGRGAEARAAAEAEPSTTISKKVQTFKLPPMVRLRRARMTMSLWVLVATGVTVGIVAGFLGAGGGFIVVPILVYLLGVPTRVAVASSLLSIVLTGGYGVAAYGSVGRVEPLAAGLLFGGALAGVQLGAMATVHAPSRAMRVLLGVTLLLAGLAVLLQQLQLGPVSFVVMFCTALAMTAAILGFLVRGRR